MDIRCPPHTLQIFFEWFAKGKALPVPVPFSIHFPDCKAHCYHFHNVLRGHIITMKVKLMSEWRNFSVVECSVAVLYTG
jgi:hypothetical protein